jgi:hypothetical protein
MTPEEESRLHELTKLIAYESDPPKLKLLAAELVDLLAKGDEPFKRTLVQRLGRDIRLNDEKLKRRGPLISSDSRENCRATNPTKTASHCHQNDRSTSEMTRLRFDPGSPTQTEEHSPCSGRWTGNRNQHRRAR